MVPFSVYVFGDTASGEVGPFLVSLARSHTEDVTPLVAVDMLTKGLTFNEAGMGLTTAVPAETRVLGVEIDDGIATVDVSAEFEAGGGTALMSGRLAQLTFTLTQFSEIDGVLLEIEGQPITVFSGEGILIEEPMTRSGFADLLPAVFVDRPGFGEEVALPLDVSGLARTFEGTVRYALTDWDGVILAEGFTTAAQPDAQSFGPFEVTIDVPAPAGGLGALIVWEDSAQDGSQIWVMEYPLQGPAAPDPFEAFVDREEARDAAVAHAARQAGVAPLDPSAWLGERVTAERLVGAERYLYTHEDWVVEVAYPVVAPENVIYDVAVTNAALGIDWRGTVNASGVVTDR
jgi:hypothetical protein